MHGSSLVPPQVACYTATNPVLYYKLMTPQWLQDHATLSHLNASSPVSLHFTLGQDSARLIKVPLFLSGALPTDDIIVTIILRIHPHLTWTFSLPFVTALSVMV